MVQSESFPTPPAGFMLNPCNAVGVEFIEGIHCSLELKNIEGEGNLFAGRDSGRAMDATETYDDEVELVKHSRRKAWTPWKNKIYRPDRLVRESQERRRGAIVHKKTQLLAECTQTLQMILSKLQGKELSEEQRAKYRAMAEKMHEKIAAISSQTKKKKKMKKSASSESYSKSSFAQTSMMWRWHMARQQEA